jgi:nucleotide-binding universal stress UspA family protein
MLRKILVPLDGSSLAEQALCTAASVAHACGSTVELVLVHTWATLGGLTQGSPTATADEKIYLHGIEAEASRRLGMKITSTIIFGLPAEAIVRHAAATDADLILMTSHGRTGFSRAWLGSVADAVVRESQIPVLIERPIENRKWRGVVTRPFKRILVPVDPTPEASAALHPALELARYMEARPVLARVVFPVTVEFSEAGVPVHGPMDAEETQRLVDAAQEQLTGIALELEADTRIAVDTEVVVGGNVAATLIDLARRKHVDLIAMSTHSRGTSRLLIASVTDKVLRGTDLPLLLVHPHYESASMAQLVGLAGSHH